MELALFNTLGREKQEFVPINDKEVTFYSCGPTAYWYAHIGNLRTYVFSDVLKRTLLFNGYNVRHVMNVTDVGHLTSDDDVGDDKLEKAAEREDKRVQEIVNHYLNAFKVDIKKLNIIDPDVWCKATENIPEQIDMIKTLEEKGFTYETKDGIYFDTSKLEDYGALAGGFNEEGLEAGKRVEMKDKKNKTDFALWKFSDEPGVRDQEWDSPWGIGFPGWHLECSAMASKYLGKQFDIHTGGEDHIHVHHPNEIAQSEAAFGVKPWVKYWLHGAFLNFKDEKISKSKGGIYTVSELEKMGFDPLSFRYFCLMAHYKKPLNFSLDALKGAQETFFKLKKKVIAMKKDLNHDYFKNTYEDDFLNAVNDDLNVPKGLGIMWDMLNNKELGNSHKFDILLSMDEVLGFDLEELEEEKVEIDDEIQDWIDKREKARESKEWETADKIRDLLKEKGIVLEDTSEGVTWKKV